MTGSFRSSRRILSRQDDRGAVIPMVAVSLVVLILGTAFSIDLGRQMSRRRDMQAIADVIALDMGRLIDGGTVADIRGTVWPADATNPTWLAQLDDSRRRNDFLLEGSRDLDDVLGTWSVESQTFTPSSAPSDTPNAVRVTTRDVVSYFFAPGSGGVNRLAIATKGGEETVDFNLGSYLATVTPFQEGILSGLFTDVFGPGTALTLVGYQGLAAGNLDLNVIAAELGFGTPTDMLDTTINAGDFFLAAASAFSCPDPPAPGANCDSVAAINALNLLATNVPFSQTFDLGDLIVVEQGGPEAVTNIPQLNALGLVTGTAQLINGNNLVSIPALTVGVPGVLTSTFDLTLIDGPLPKVKLDAIPGPLCDETPGTGNCLRVPQINFGLVNELNLLGLTGQINLRVQAANATAHPIDAECGGAQSATMQLNPVPATVTAELVLSGGVSLIGLPIIGVTVNLPVVFELGGPPQTHTYGYTQDFLPPVGTGDAVPLGASVLGLQGALRVPANPSVLQATIFGFPVPPIDLGQIAQVLNGILDPVLAQLDTQVISELVKTLGLSLGGGFVGAIDMDCAAGGDLKLVK